MLALQKLRPEPGIALHDVAAPAAPGPGDVLIAVEATGICGTDLHIAAWTSGYASMKSAMPVTLGHEFCGRVLQAGPGVPVEAAGQRVTVRPSVLCHDCAACHAGDFDHCTGRKGVGIGRNGAFAAQVLVPWENCVAVPIAMPPEVAALTEPMTVCHEAVETAGIRPGDRVLVIGPGTIGQGIALFAEVAGAAEIVVVGHDDAARLATVRELGFPNTADSFGRSLTEAVAPWTGAGLFDVVIEAAGVPSIVPEALSLLRKRGVLVIAGIHAAPATIDLTALVRDHKQIRGTYRAPVEAWPQVVDYLSKNAARVGEMITARLPISRADEGFRLAAAKRDSKVIILQDEVRS
ncbi:alcohol dehydrogenase catalytic domain-containing protein [Paracoccus sp. CPCC 101403]|uniref:Alcohol dehydrogenase catalytic domain-containing protein n=1 Tax=Paracoccus broussonetiae TaxID=3075834 RepID=A0ABU3E9B8_9RHOB|nr:alcohol dehydrogenase catalytic domain-containing protein [Paracoccus sp. CPCC 101403]MDT1060810.1 alcohol dehydrogenase catalytic domain-containing protein [Paracoccus sp. CPCC 101403]